MPLSHLAAVEMVATSFECNSSNLQQMVEHLLTVTPTELIDALDNEVSKGNDRRRFGLQHELSEDDSEILSNPAFFANVANSIAAFYDGFNLSRKEIDHLAIAFFMYLGMTSPDFPISDE